MSELPEVETYHAAKVMSEALALGRTSFDAMYVNVNGEVFLGLAWQIKLN